MMRTRILIVTWLTMAGVGTAVAQEARLQGRVPESVRASIDLLLDSARADGLPVEPLVDRALEGASKGAPADRIVGAVRRLAGELAAARGALGPGSNPAEIASGASALRAGAGPDDLARLRSRRAGQSLLVPAAVLADLVAVGVPVDTAVAAVLAMADGFDDAAYIAFRRNVERDIGLGASPVSAVGVRLVGVDLATEPGAPNPTSAPRPRKP